LAGPAKPANIEIYFAAGQAQSLPVAPADLAVRTTGNPRDLINALQHELSVVDKDQPVTAVRTLDEVLAQSTSGTRFNAFLLSVRHTSTCSGRGWHIRGRVVCHRAACSRDRHSRRRGSTPCRHSWPGPTSDHFANRAWQRARHGSITCAKSVWCKHALRSH